MTRTLFLNEREKDGSAFPSFLFSSLGFILYIFLVSHFVHLDFSFFSLFFSFSFFEATRTPPNGGGYM